MCKIGASLGRRAAAASTAQAGSSQGEARSGCGSGWAVSALGESAEAALVLCERPSQGVRRSD